MSNHSRLAEPTQHFPEQSRKTRGADIEEANVSCLAELLFATTPVRLKAARLSIRLYISRLKHRSLAMLRNFLPGIEPVPGHTFPTASIRNPKRR
ncbi:hypothetical protein OEG84_06765 [Hoeflea sp. G2-23]|uniref:Uncharacterized protein n=1 Tax=Hoeflea algicola TaxID=2983763 RepID=A0ABT3Z6L7_9HYPH|nr:hypothetical protein [Hoeflea algicola]MCY0147420.1 hypothetical protein [Hoeflea algicola]